MGFMEDSGVEWLQVYTDPQCPIPLKIWLVVVLQLGVSLHGKVYS